MLQHEIRIEVIEYQTTIRQLSLFCIYFIRRWRDARALKQHSISVAFFIALMCFELATARCVAVDTIDPLGGTSEPEKGLIWYDLQLLDVEGRGWTDTKSFYDRLPAKAETIVRPEVWRLSRQSSGLCVRFVTDATSLRVKWTLGLERLAEWNMPAAAISGLDLYVKHDGQWRWLAVGKPEKQTNEVNLFNDISHQKREFLLYLPLYNTVTSIALGLPMGAMLAKAESYAPDRKPIVFYGTSITQGGCASRPGMVYTAILGRRLKRQVINLGFRANGNLDAEMAPLLSELDPSIYVLDCLPNLLAPEIAERVEPFVTVLRKAHPVTPILLVEDRTYPDGFLNSSRQERNVKSRAALRAAYDRLLNAGTRNVYYLHGTQLLGDDGEATVDASHPTDLGFVRMADAFESVLRPILSKQEAPPLSE